MIDPAMGAGVGGETPLLLAHASCSASLMELSRDALNTDGLSEPSVLDDDEDVLVTRPRRVEMHAGACVGDVKNDALRPLIAEIIEVDSFGICSVTDTIKLKQFRLFSSSRG